MFICYIWADTDFQACYYSVTINFIIVIVPDIN